MAQSLLTCGVHVQHGTATLTATGELDVTTAPILRNAVDRAVEQSPVFLVMDLTAVTFCDSTSLAELVRANNQSDNAGIRLSVVPSPFVGRLLDITGLTDVLHTVWPDPSPDEDDTPPTSQYEDDHPRATA